MEPFAQVDIQSLEWKQPNVGGRLYELHSDKGIVARLNWRGKPGALTTAQATGREWAFTRESYLTSPQVHILASGTDGTGDTGADTEPTQVGNYRSGRGSSGVLQLVDGREYVWARSGRWRSGGTFSVDGQPIVHLKWNPGPFRAGARIEVVDSAASDLSPADLLLLVVVGWYLMRLKADDDAIAAGSAAAAIAATSVTG